MHLKQLLSLAAISGVASNHGDLPQHASAIDGRLLQAGLPPSVTCLVGGKSVDECCPTGADPEDGVCSLLFCVDLSNFGIKEECKCGMFTTACEQLKMAYTMVPGMEAMCNQAGTCCDGGGATNCGFNACVKAAVDDGAVELPDLSLFGSIIDLGNSSDAAAAAPAEPCPEVEAPAANATTASTAAPAVGATEAAPATTAGTTAPATTAGTTAPADVDGADASSDATQYAARAWAPLAVLFAAVLG